MSNDTANLIRVMLAILPGTILFAIAAAVVRTYGAAYRLERKVRRARSRRSEGLLPKHVFYIGTSYLLLVLRSLIETVDRIYDDAPIAWWRVAMNLAAYALGVVALLTILRFERRRYRDAQADTKARGR